MSIVVKAMGMERPVRVIDAHIHMVDDFSDVQAMFERMRTAYRAAGFRAVCFVNDTSAGRLFLHKNLLSILYKLLYPHDEVYLFAGLDYHVPGKTLEADGFGAQARALLDIGFDGFKMYEGKPSARKRIGSRSLLDPAYEAFYETLAARGAPAAIHMGDPPYFWNAGMCDADVFENDWYFGDTTYASYDMIEREIREVLQRYPKMKVIIPQMAYCTGDFDRLSEMLERYPNLTFDLGPTGEFYAACQEQREEAKAFFRTYAERVVFACTGVAKDPASIAPKAEKLIELLCGGDEPIVPRERWNEVFADGFTRLVGAPRQIDRERALAYLEEISAYLARCPQTKSELGRVRARVDEIAPLYRRLCMQKH